MQKYFLINLIVLIVPLGLYSLYQPDCGRINKKYRSEYHIVGGTRARYMEFPMLVLFNHKSSYFCGGAILTPKFVITAAHCFHYHGRRFPVKGIKRIKILFGLGNLTKSEEYYRFYNEIIKVVLHPEYDNNEIPRRGVAYYRNDIALIKVKRHINLGKDTPFKPICLPEQGQTFKGRTIVAGWGKLWESGPYSTTLLKVVLPIINNTACNALSEWQMRPPTAIIDTNMCTYNTNGAGTCQGDSGSPAMVYHKNRLYISGILSYGIGCGGFDVYTRVPSYVHWIEETINRETT